MIHSFVELKIIWTRDEFNEHHHWNRHAKRYSRAIRDWRELDRCKTVFVAKINAPCDRPRILSRSNRRWLWDRGAVSRLHEARSDRSCRTGNGAHNLERFSSRFPYGARLYSTCLSALYSKNISFNNTKTYFAYANHTSPFFARAEPVPLSPHPSVHALLFPHVLSPVGVSERKASKRDSITQQPIVLTYRADGNYH